MKKLISKSTRLEQEIWGDHEIITFLNSFNPFKNDELRKKYETKNRENNYINYVYKLDNNTYGYLQLIGKKYNEVFRVTGVKVEATAY